MLAPGRLRRFARATVIFWLFIEKELTKLSTVTSGRIYKEIIDCELSGGYKGKTIQVIPHVTNKIKEKIYNIINFEQPDFLLIEIGGTVGDAE